MARQTDLRGGNHLEDNGELELAMVRYSNGRLVERTAALKSLANFRHSLAPEEKTTMTRFTSDFERRRALEKAAYEILEAYRRCGQAERDFRSAAADTLRTQVGLGAALCGDMVGELIGR
jgi:hypothetical protein